MRSRLHLQLLLDKEDSMNGLARMVAGLALFTLVGLALPACGGSPAPSPSPSPSSGVRGVSMIVGGLASTPWPQPGTTIAVHEGSLDGAVVARTKAGAHGVFVVDLQPGRYTLVQVSDAAMPKTVTVTPGDYASVKLIIQAR
jgi:hypothetical protein